MRSEANAFYRALEIHEKYTRGARKSPELEHVSELRLSGIQKMLCFIMSQQNSCRYKANMTWNARCFRGSKQHLIILLSLLLLLCLFPDISRLLLNVDCALNLVYV